MRGIVNQVLRRLLIVQHNSVSSTQLAKEAGISRQAAHKHLRKLQREGLLIAHGKARACRYQSVSVPKEVTVLRQRLEVASAGSLYRLSARLLLVDIEAGEVTLDFTGVADVGEEFLDEIFLVWAPAHPQVKLKVSHLPARFAPMLFGLATRLPKAPAPGEQVA